MPIMKISNEVIYAGVNDTDIDLFERQYSAPDGMSYNSYVILDEKIAVIDTVDAAFTHEWLDNLGTALGNRLPDYLIIQHMEPDHSANIANFLRSYPAAKLVCNTKTVKMIEQFFASRYEDRLLTVENGDTLSLGTHLLHFIFAPMVHWPEVMMVYDERERLLFSADAFGRFGTPDADIPWEDEARRYYFGIVGKYGAQVQAVLRKISALAIDIIAPLHGPVLKADIDRYIKLYGTWASYEPEQEGVVIAFASVYGNTQKAAELLQTRLLSAGAPKAVLYDLTRCDMSRAIADAFRYSKLVLASVTYNAGIFPSMKTFISGLCERGYKNRAVAFVENGSWAPQAAAIMRQMLVECKNLTFAENTVTVNSTTDSIASAEIDALCAELCKDYADRRQDEDKNDLSALFNIGYGLYVVTCNDGEKDNGLILNTVSQLTSSPNRIAVTINKSSYSHHIISRTKKMNVNCLCVDTPFSIFEQFGFVSGRYADKFRNTAISRSSNGLIFLDNHINSYISLEAESCIDLETHSMFICRITEARVINSKETMTYTYYHKNIKPAPATQPKKGFVCRICGYVYEGDSLPENFICPLCKHPASDFEPIKK